MAQLCREFLRYHALRSKLGSVRGGDGVEAAWAHSLLAVNNGTYLSGEVLRVDDLRSRCRAAAADAAPHGLPWLFFIYEPLVSAELIPRIDNVLAEEGFNRAGGLREMAAAAHALATPVRPLPDVACRRIATEEDRLAALHLNCLGYGMPLEIGTSVIETGSYYSDAATEFGFIALVEGQPVSTASVLVVDESLYVEAVATAPAHQKRGYAEAVMRHAISEASAATGLTATYLDASAAGCPLYRQMGYGSLADWRYYVAAG